MSQISRSKQGAFDPCSLFPARVKAKVWTAKGREKSGGVGGATDLTKRVAYLPEGNNAYDRTVRLHESLHAIYTPPPTKERIKSGKPYTMLEQALEDARLHLVCAKTQGTVRRDELATALTDLRKGSGGDKNLAALLALRSQAIRLGGDYTVGGKFLQAKLEKLCAEVSSDYYKQMMAALECINEDRLSDAERILSPYFEDRGAEEQKAWPSAGKGGEGGGSKSFADVSFSKIEGKLSSDAADMLPAHMAESIEASKMPTLQIHQLFAAHMIPTFFGETTKHTISGSKISAKKLATIVGPATPRIFYKTIRRNGGTVLIDASGSMNLKEETLIKMLTSAPAATIAFYNAPTDSHMTGNLWIFGHKGKRAADFSGIEFAYRNGMYTPEHPRTDKHKWPKHVYGYGNVVDFQALQWLLAQPAPRYVLTDGQFTGPAISQEAARKLLETAIARKKITQVTSLGKMQEILAKGEGK